MSHSSGATARGERTREHLLDVAEQLLSARGIESVSLREIRLAAGQRNTSALQFHFGDRAGLVSAIAERHRPRQRAVRLGLYKAMVNDGRQGDPRSLVEIFVRPTAEYVFQGPGARAWVRIEAELAARPELQFQDFMEHATPETLEVGTAMLDRLETMVPRRIGFERILMMSLAGLHMCADRARIEGSDHTGRRHMSQPDFVDNIIDMSHAALFAPLRRGAEHQSTSV